MRTRCELGFLQWVNSPTRLEREMQGLPKRSKLVLLQVSWHSWRIWHSLRSKPEVSISMTSTVAVLAMANSRMLHDRLASSQASGIRPRKLRFIPKGCPWGRNPDGGPDTVASSDHRTP